MMIDEGKLKTLKLIGLVSLVVVLVFLALYFSFFRPGKQEETKKETNRTQQVSELPDKDVESFLMAYYTKKKNGANRKQYRAYMTDKLYNQTVSIEDEPQNKLYANYLSNQVYQSASIYTNQQKKTVLAFVTYTVDFVEKQNNESADKRSVTNQVTIKLTYKQEGDKLLVDKLESVLLVDNSNANQLSNAVDNTNRITE